MARVSRRPQAEDDILEIWNYIAEDSVVEADRWVDGAIPPRITSKSRFSSSLFVDTMNSW